MQPLSFARSRASCEKNAKANLVGLAGSGRLSLLVRRRGRGAVSAPLAWPTSAARDQSNRGVIAGPLTTERTR